MVLTYIYGMVLSHTEENYLKCLYHHAIEERNIETEVKHISTQLGVRPATVTSMIKKLASKELVHHTRYGKIQLTETGENLACAIIRKHRLWEVFLVDILKFKWDEVHEVAEQLEHVKSQKLIEYLDAFLGYPDFDPHGDPIPNNQGVMPNLERLSLHHAELNQRYEVVSVKDAHNELLSYLLEKNIQLKSEITVLRHFQYDDSVLIQIGIDTEPLLLSGRMASNIMIRLIHEK